MDQVSLAGSTVIVTGSNTGIGKETARELARRGARVIMACRNQERGEKARDEIASDTGNDNVLVRILDLASLASIKEFAEDFCLSESRLDILVNNAAVVTSKRELTSDGFEMIIGVTHLGHFYLTYLLLDKLKASAPSRVVTVASSAHEMCSLNFNDLQLERGWSYLKAYGRSKTANILFSKHLGELLKGTGVTTYSLHPGVVKTEINRQVDSTCIIKCFYCFGPCVGLGRVPTDEGALTSIYCCLEPSIATDTGFYYSDQRQKRAKRHATDPQLAERLWNLSKELCGL